MTSFYEQQRAEQAAKLWPGVDLDETVPRHVAYREVYSRLNKWAQEQTAYTYSELRSSGHRQYIPGSWQEAGYKAAARIAEDIYVRIGNRLRKYLACLPEEKAAPKPARPAPKTSRLPARVEQPELPLDGARQVVTISAQGEVL